MKKKLLMVVALLLVLAGCGEAVEDSTQAEEPERKETITNEETMNYLEEILEPFLKTSNVKSEEDMYEVAEEIDIVATDIKRELKREYEQDINAVDDLIALTDLHKGLVGEMEDNNVALISAYGDDIGSQIGKIAIDYLDGELPDNYAEAIGVDNIYDMD